jgi:hypothetical protein
MSEVVCTAGLRFAGVVQASVDICLSVLVCTNARFVLYSCARRRFPWMQDELPSSTKNQVSQDASRDDPTLAPPAPNMRRGLRTSMQTTSDIDSVNRSTRAVKSCSWSSIRHRARIGWSMATRILWSGSTAVSVSRLVRNYCDTWAHEYSDHPSAVVTGGGNPPGPRLPEASSRALS